MTTHALRQQLAHLAHLQAVLDALKLDINIQLKEVQRCTTAHDTAVIGATGISPRSGFLSAS